MCLVYDGVKSKEEMIFILGKNVIIYINVCICNKCSWFVYYIFYNVYRCECKMCILFVCIIDL